MFLPKRRRSALGQPRTLLARRRELRQKRTAAFQNRDPNETTPHRIRAIKSYILRRSCGTHKNKMAAVLCLNGHVLVFFSSLRRRRRPAPRMIYQQ